MLWNDSNGVITTEYSTNFNNTALPYSSIGNIVNSIGDINASDNNNSLNINNNSRYGYAAIISFYNPVKNYVYNIVPYKMNNITNIIDNTNNNNNMNEHHIMSFKHNNNNNILENYLNSTTNNFSDYLFNNLTINDSTYINDDLNNNLTTNTSYISSMSKKDFVFDRTDVKIIFITLYSLVFCCCFFGNLLVILVVTLSRRLRSITNFFLANLAVADFCVGVFCVMQNLTIYLIDSWVFGEFLCRMYQFVHSLSYTASIFILVVICMERYFAIIHPITCKQILTPSRLRLVIFGVWITSAVYSTPKFIFSTTITNLHTNNSIEEKICILDRKMFNSKLLDLINFGLLYVTPLLVMTILYSRIAIALWKSSRGLERHIALQNTSTCSPSYSANHLYRRQSSKYEKKTVNVTESQVSVDSTDKVIVTTWKKPSFHQRHGTQITQMSHSSNNVLRARRGVIRMLIIVVLTFALCNLPYHARKMWQNWSNTYKGDSNFIALFTPLTFLVTYFNSGVNPLLYAFLSRNFRKGMRELLLCSFKKGKSKSSSIHQRIPLHITTTILRSVNIPSIEHLRTSNNIESTKI